MFDSNGDDTGRQVCRQLTVTAKRMRKRLTQRCVPPNQNRLAPRSQTKQPGTWRSLGIASVCKVHASRPLLRNNLSSNYLQEAAAEEAFSSGSCSGGRIVDSLGERRRCSSERTSVVYVTRLQLMLTL